MRIGIDGGSFLSRRTGIGRYVEEMSLALLDLGADITIYIPKAMAPEVPGAIRAIASTASLGRISGQAWTQFFLPAKVADDGMDVFWGPAHRLPICLSRRVRTVLTIHDLVWKLYPETMHSRTYLGERFLMPPSIARADAIAADTEATASTLRHYFPSAASRISVIYPGAPPVTQALGSTTLTLPSNYILFVGTLEPRKNLERLLQAYATLPNELKAKHPLVVAGGQGWRQRDLSGLASELGIERHIQLEGFVSDDRLAMLYSQCLFLAFPSVYEGFGLPIVEANRSGRPVLTSRSSSMPEVGGAACHLVDPLDVQSIAAGLQKMIEDRTYRDQLSSNAEANADRFNWGASAKLLLSQFATLVATK